MLGLFWVWIMCTCWVHDSPLFCMNWNLVWYWFWWIVCVNRDQFCKYRPSESISPKRELKNLVSGFRSRCSLRRPGLVLSDEDSRLGKSGSPKRVREEAYTILSATSRPCERFWVLSDGYSRLGESGSPRRVHEVIWRKF